MKLTSEQQIAVLRAINHTSRPATTLRIWSAALAVVEYEIGAIDATATELAEIAEIHPTEARRALATLAEIGALQRTARGRYKINPQVAWAGSQASRDAAAKDAAPVLTIAYSRPEPEAAS